MANAVNPATDAGLRPTRWTGAIPYTPIPADLQSVSGGRGDRRLDPDLSVEYLDEYTGGVDLGVNKDLIVRFNVVRKRDYRGSKELDLAQPYEAFTDVATGIDPGRDNVVGTADDGTVTV